MHGFWRVAIASPELSVADPKQNAQEILKHWQHAEADEASVILFPELSLSGYTCADLFHQARLLDACREEMLCLVRQSATMQTMAIVGMPLQVNGRLFNAALVLGRGKIWGAVPKSHLPNYKEFYEKRWFTSGLNVRDEIITLGGESVPFGPDLLFRFAEGYTFGIEICEDLWAPISPSTKQCLAGAEIVFNASASNEVIGKSDYREKLVTDRSSRCIAGYVYVSSGVGESTTDLVFSGDGFICENGAILERNERYLAGGQYRFADVDVQRLRTLRRAESTFADFGWDKFRQIELDRPRNFSKWQRKVVKHPFVPRDDISWEARCQEVLTIQITALIRRLAHIKAASAVIGVSGGLDSTLALLVAHEAVKEVTDCNVLAITMPGFGTTTRTKQNAVRLCELLGAELREVDIRAACNQHLKDIGHDGVTPDITFENVQARERTQVLMDIANQQGGIVIGTGDLSEMALGWSTYNGDHMSMYAVNCGVPKTLVRHLVAWYAAKSDAQTKAVLDDIVDTPVSPELLPVDPKGKGKQETERTLGPYEVHDFFLYQMLRNGADPARMLFLAEQAYSDRYAARDLGKWLRIFVTRFFNNQFKRSCVPDGPKVGTISLSPRGDWRMPSDALYKAWID